MVDARTKAWETWQEETHEGWDFQITFDAGWDAAMKELNEHMSKCGHTGHNYCHQDMVKRLGLK